MSGRRPTGRDIPGGSLRVSPNRFPGFNSRSGSRPDPRSQMMKIHRSSSSNSLGGVSTVSLDSDDSLDGHAPGLRAPTGPRYGRRQTGGELRLPRAPLARPVTSGVGVRRDFGGDSGRGGFGFSSRRRMPRPVTTGGPGGFGLPRRRRRRRGGLSGRTTGGVSGSGSGFVKRGRSSQNRRSTTMSGGYGGVSGRAGLLSSIRRRQQEEAFQLSLKQQRFAVMKKKQKTRGLQTPSSFLPHRYVDTKSLPLPLKLPIGGRGRGVDLDQARRIEVGVETTAPGSLDTSRHQRVMQAYCALHKLLNNRNIHANIKSGYLDDLFQIAAYFVARSMRQEAEIGEGKRRARRLQQHVDELMGREPTLSLAEEEAEAQSNTRLATAHPHAEVGREAREGLERLRPHFLQKLKLGRVRANTVSDPKAQPRYSPTGLAQSIGVSVLPTMSDLMRLRTSLERLKTDLYSYKEEHQLLSRKQKPEEVVPSPEDEEPPLPQTTDERSRQYMTLLFGKVKLLHEFVLFLKKKISILEQSDNDLRVLTRQYGCVADLLRVNRELGEKNRVYGWVEKRFSTDFLLDSRWWRNPSDDCCSPHMQPIKSGSAITSKTSSVFFDELDEEEILRNEARQSRILRAVVFALQNELFYLRECVDMLHQNATSWLIVQREPVDLRQQLQERRFAKLSNLLSENFSEGSLFSALRLRDDSESRDDDDISLLLRQHVEDGDGSVREIRALRAKLAILDAENKSFRESLKRSKKEMTEIRRVMALLQDRVQSATGRFQLKELDSSIRRQLQQMAQLNRTLDEKDAMYIFNERKVEEVQAERAELKAKNVFYIEKVKGLKREFRSLRSKFDAQTTGAKVLREIAFSLLQFFFEQREYRHIFQSPQLDPDLYLSHLYTDMYRSYSSVMSSAIRIQAWWRGVRTRRRLLSQGGYLITRKEDRTLQDVRNEDLRFSHFSLLSSDQYSEAERRRRAFEEDYEEEGEEPILSESEAELERLRRTFHLEAEELKDSNQAIEKLRDGMTVFRLMNKCIVFSGPKNHAFSDFGTVLKAVRAEVTTRLAEGLGAEVRGMKREMDNIVQTIVTKVRQVENRDVRERAMQTSDMRMVSRGVQIGITQVQPVTFSHV